ncbi:hypothetical protein CSC02_1734 [Enterobacter hormaechei subsp. hoffmannii]|nr:hypothetical protein CSC02_1734 [Enterobacter hormaechei subsp. hoffmannii]
MILVISTLTQTNVLNNNQMLNFREKSFEFVMSSHQSRENSTTECIVRVLLVFGVKGGRRHSYA